MNYVKIILVVFLVGISTGRAEQFYGLHALELVEDLPCIRRGVSAHQVSSFERNGRNDDRNSWLYKDEYEDYVIFDDVGAGCIYRLWMTWGGGSTEYRENYTTNHIKIYLDGEVEPRFECSLNDLFSGMTAPFVAPFVGDRDVSSGGYYSYVPIAYANRCKISLTHIPSVSMRNVGWGPDMYWMYYNITHHKYASSDGIASWAGQENYSIASNLLEKVREDPKSTNDNSTLSGEVSLLAGSNCVVQSHSGTGVLNELTFDISEMSADQLNNLWLKVFWDGQQTPAVHAPFGEFFGSGFGPTTVNSLLMGMHDGHYYSYFPMPFWQSFRIELENKGSMDIGPINYSIEIGTRLYDIASAGYFHARYADQSFTHKVVSSDFEMLSEEGRGHYVGVTLSCTGYVNGLAFLEGDERFYIDGSLTPQLHGTGNEDYFNGGWYYNRGNMSLPFHGSPIRSSPFGMRVDRNYIGAYRLHVGDVIPFNSSIKLGMEHGGFNNVGCRMSSVCYFYKLAGTNSGLQLCTELDVGDSASELMANFQFSGDVPVVTDQFSYPGDEHDVVSIDDGRHFMESCSFSVSIPSINDGLLIRRKMDAGMGKQSCRVFVDDAFVADWVYIDEGFKDVEQRWHTAELYVPYAFTAGKKQVDLSFSSGSDTSVWNAYSYSIYAIKPLQVEMDMDFDDMPDAWETIYFNNLKSGIPLADSDADGINNRDEYICQTDPQDRSSVFSLKKTSENRYKVETAEGRMYEISYCTNLVTDFWKDDYISFKGTGSNYIFSGVSSVNDTIFYRAEVRLTNEKDL